MPPINTYDGWQGGGKDKWYRYFNDHDSRIVLHHETRHYKSGDKHYTNLALQVRVFDESDAVDYWIDVVRTRQEGHIVPTIVSAIDQLFAELRTDIIGKDSL